jgi:ABC-type phosphate/phosphonate transport system substrate-binding protein
MKSRSLLQSLLVATVLAAVAPCVALAEDAKTETKAPVTIREALQANVGKRVLLRLQAGEDIDGTVVAVTAGTVHIARLTGKDFYDAVVSLDKISAVIFKAR